MGKKNSKHDWLREVFFRKKEWIIKKPSHQWFDMNRYEFSWQLLLNLEMAQFDVKTAFLYGHLDETIFMRQPQGFEKGSMVCRLKKSLYGLKQSPRCWNNEFRKFLKNFHFHQTNADPCVYVGEIHGNKIYLLLFVDDGLLMSKSKDVIEKVLHDLRNNFKITTADGSCFVGIEIHSNRERGIIAISQTRFIKKVLKKFNMSECSDTSIPADPGVRLKKGTGQLDVKIPFREAVGTLLFIAMNTRPDIAYAVSYLSQFLDCFTNDHWIALKRIMKYLSGTKEYGIVYQRTDGDSLNLVGYTDADYAGDLDSRKSRSGYVFTINASPVTWMSQRQPVVALSTTEAEYIALSFGGREALWLRRMLEEFEICESSSTTMNVDNQSAIRLACNPEFHKRSKHIDVKFHFVRDIVEKGEIKIQYINSKLQLADIFTKPLPKSIFVVNRERLKILNLNEKEGVLK